MAKADFDFGPEKQRSMLALMLSDLAFASKAIKYAPRDRFHSEAHRWFFGLIEKKFEERGIAPTIVDVEDDLKRAEVAKRRLYRNFAKDIFKAPASDPELIKDGLTAYAKRSLFVSLFEEAQVLWNSREYVGAYEFMFKGMGELYGVSCYDDVAIEIEDFEELRQRYLLERAFSLGKIPTGIPELDDVFGGGLGKGEMAILLAEPKKGKCQCAESSLLLGDGSTRTLGEVVKSKEKSILSFNEATGEFEKDEIIDWIESGEKEVFNLRTTSSSLKLTGCYPLLTLSGWKPLKDLNPKDRIFVPRVLPHGTESSLSEARLTLLAYMLADGTMNKSWSWSKKEPAMISEFEECHSTFADKKFDRSKGYHYPSTKMKMWFKELGLIGCLSGTKFIPAIVERQDSAGVAHFLNKIFTCDGSPEASGKISYCSKSHRMISQIQSLLLRFSIASSLKEIVVNGESYFEIGIQGCNAIRFQKNIGMSHSKGKRLTTIEIKESDREYVRGFSSDVWELIWSETSEAGLSRRKLWESVTGRIASDRQHHFKQGSVSLNLLSKINCILESDPIQKIIDGQWIMTTVLSIEPVGVEMTYDIEVKKNHNFIAENIITHNSIGLIHMGSACLMSRVGRVAHFVLEGITEQTSMRYQSRLSHIPYNRIKNDQLTEKEEGVMKRVGETYMKRLSLIPMNSHWNYTVLDIESKIKELERIGKKPDLVVVDYGDLLKSHEPGVAEMRHQQTAVFRGLKQLAMIQSVALWTASQAVRPKDGPEKESLLRAKDISESFEKVRIADFLATLNQTPREKEMGIMRFHMDIYRDNDPDRTLRFIVDYSRMVFYSKKLGHISNMPSWKRKR